MQDRCRRIDGILLRRTAGPYIRVRSRNRVPCPITPGKGQVRTKGAPTQILRILARAFFP